jgi:hypothetical protein
MVLFRHLICATANIWASDRKLIEQTQLHNEAVHNLYSLSNITKS